MQNDPEYIIILHELSEDQTDVLFEHTRRLRSARNTTLITEERGSRLTKPEYAWVRRKKGSPEPGQGAHVEDGKGLRAFFT